MAATAPITLDGGAGEDTADYSTVSHSSTCPASTRTSRAARPPRSTPAARTAADSLKGFEDLLGSDYDDTLTGNGKANTLDGGLGDDTMKGGDGGDHLRGGAGDDTLSGSDGIDRLEGADGSDTLNGNDGADELDGGADDDTLNGGAGADRLIGASGDDTLSAGNGDDSLAGGAGDDRETGGSGKDRFDQGPSNDGADRLDGGSGTDTVDYRGRHGKLTITVGQAANDGEKGEGDNVMKTIEVVFGGSGADKMTASTAGTVLHGGNGNDALTGGKGADYLDGGGGKNTAKRVGKGDRVAFLHRSCDSDPRRRHGRYAPGAAAPGAVARDDGRGLRGGRPHPPYRRRDRPRAARRACGAGSARRRRGQLRRLGRRCPAARRADGRDRRAAQIGLVHDPGPERGRRAAPACPVPGCARRLLRPHAPAGVRGPRRPAPAQPGLADRAPARAVALLRRADDGPGSGAGGAHRPALRPPQESRRPPARVILDACWISASSGSTTGGA